MKLSYANYILKKVQKDYNDIADEFSRTRSSIWPETKFLGDKIENGDKILDVGCGSGRLYELFSDRKIEYFGIDFAKRLIKLAKRKYSEDTGKEEKKNIPTFINIDALRLPFDDNFFDKIFSVAVLHHIPSSEKRLEFLLEIKRVLKPGGEVFLTVWNLWQKKYIKLILKFSGKKIFKKSKLDFFDVFLPFQNNQRYYHCFRKKELEDIIKEAGLKVKEIRFLERNNKNCNIFVCGRKLF